MAVMNSNSCSERFKIHNAKFVLEKEDYFHPQYLAFYLTTKGNKVIKAKTVISNIYSNLLTYCMEALS